MIRLPLILLTICCFYLLCNILFAQNEDIPTFVNLQNESSIPFIGTTGQLAVWGDYNIDGWQDIFLSNSDRRPRGRKRLSASNSGNTRGDVQRSFFFLNQDGRFTNYSDLIGIPNSRYKTAAWADYNNDGFPDLLIGTKRGSMPAELYKNIDGIYFENISDQAGITKNGSTVTHAIWADYNNDGDIDFLQSGTGQVFLYRNNGNGRFDEAAANAGINTKLTSSATWLDINNDGYLDLFLTKKGANVMYLNLGDETFLDISELSGLAGSQNWKTTSACVGDFNNDGYMDLYITNIGRAYGNALYRNNGDNTFTNITFESSTNDVGDGRTCAWVDFDADGKLDLFTTNHLHPNRLYRNLGNEVFVDVAESSGIEKPIDVFAATWGDYNRDGFMDVFLNGHIGTGLMKNNGNSNNTITLNLKGDGYLSNSSAIGARVEVQTGSATQVREVSGGRGCCEQDMLPVNFGLGENIKVDVVVKWPSGRQCSFSDLSVEDVNHYIIDEIKCDIIPSYTASE